MQADAQKSTMTTCKKTEKREKESLSSEKRRMQKEARIVVFKLAVVIFALMLCWTTQANPDHRRFKAGDPIPFYVNKIASFPNPSESYSYYKLPFCMPETVEYKKQTLGEMLNGDRMLTAPYSFSFLQDKDAQVVCGKNLSRIEVSRFRAAVLNDYFVEMFFDGLPTWAFLGMDFGQHRTYQSERRFKLFTHMSFDVSFNNDHVTGILTSQDSPVDITEDKELYIQFSYTAKWKKTNEAFERRMEKYFLDPSLMGQLEKHQLSLQNSCFTVLLVAGCLLTFYVKVLKKEFELTGSLNDAERASEQQRQGWKNIHVDVFRYPKCVSLLAAVLGSGIQLLTLALIILVLGVFGAFQPYDGGDIWTTLLAVYTITSGIAGHTSASFYQKLNGLCWWRNLILTGCIFSLPMLVTFCLLNSIAAAYDANTTLPRGPIVTMLLIWLLVALPLLLLGGLVGKRSKPGFEVEPPSECGRHVPPGPWYKGTLPQVAAAGLLPFGVVFTEFHHIMTSLWAYTSYNIYGILLIVFFMFLTVAALVTIAFTYFQLTAEDYHWWWRSFLCGGSAAVYMYGYCFYYYFWVSRMSGVLQTSVFFAYMGLVCFGVFLMVGTVGFLASLTFVRHIYSCIKFD